MSKFLERKQWTIGAHLLLAAVLFASPWVLDHVAEPFPTWNAWLSAAVIAALALAGLVSFTERGEWLELLAGGWVAASPWVLGYSSNTRAMGAHVVLGALVAVVAVMELWHEYQQPRAVA